MMKALGAMQKLPGPGEVLRLGPNASFLLQQEYDSLYVRKCYAGAGRVRLPCTAVAGVCVRSGVGSSGSY